MLKVNYILYRAIQLKFEKLRLKVFRSANITLQVTSKSLPILTPTAVRCEKNSNTQIPKSNSANWRNKWRHSLRKTQYLPESLVMLGHRDRGGGDRRYGCPRVMTGG